jgi:Na+:H+ antiporter, NhaA family
MHRAALTPRRGSRSLPRMTGDSPLPREPIDGIIGPLERFLHVEAAGGMVLLVCTAVALGFANSPFAEPFLHFWEAEAGVVIGPIRLQHPLEHWINDGLMVLFFFVVGLEVKRELVLGELRDPRQATLPLVAAAGGMVVPAGIYLALQTGGEAARGWGIPMATDIAFVVGCMALLGSRVPPGLRIMLLSLAIADDIGAILVIALGYSTGIHVPALLAGGLGLVAVALFQRLGVRAFSAYVALGGLIWVAFEHSGIHATIAGVILGLMTPAHAYLGDESSERLADRVADLIRRGKSIERPRRTAQVRSLRRATRELISPLEYLESALHPWVSFVVMPVFALANAGVPFDGRDLGSPVAAAVALGLVLGKPLGITAFAWIAVRVGFARLPRGVGWGAIAGGGLVAGIGFTMALFIAGLALDGAQLTAAKVGILGGSALAALAGMVVLLAVLPKGAG